MDIRIFPGRLSGVVKAPPSKSLAHRAIICAALADGVSRIHGISGSKDMDATIGCMQALGTHIERDTEQQTAVIKGLRSASMHSSEATEPAVRHTEQTEDAVLVLDCIESGSTLRFILPVAAALGRSCRFTGRGKLPERPMTPLADPMKAHGIRFEPDGRDRLPFSISGTLQPGLFEVPGDVSSQYISGLLFALPLLTANSQIRIVGSLESASYIRLTLQTLGDFGIQIAEMGDGFLVPGRQNYRAFDAEIEGDYSNGAFWMAANACGSGLTVTGLRPDTAQGDRRAADILKGGRFYGREIDCGDIPDLVPVLSVAAAAAPQTTRFYNAGRLRIKESDRLAAMAENLSRLGADVEERKDELIVHGGKKLTGGCEVSGFNDHRIVMSMAVAGLICEKPILIRGAQAVSKSYPDFFEEFRRLGGRAENVQESTEG